MGKDMKLNDWQIEMMKETFNVGVGRAAQALSELTENQHQVILSVPHVDILNTDELFQMVSQISGGHICAVSQGYSGPFEGTAVMLYSEEESLQLVQIMLGSEFPIYKMTEMESDALCEVGNIILNACLGAIGSLINQQIATELPTLHRGTPKDVLAATSAVESDYVIYLRMGFTLAAMNLSGHISFMIEPFRINNLVTCLEEFYKDQLGEKLELGDINE